MLLLFVFSYNTERINSAYAPYHGRYVKTNGGLPSINCDFYDWTAWRDEFILFFACTFRDIIISNVIVHWCECTLSN